MKKTNVFSALARVRFLSVLIIVCSIAVSLADVAMKKFSGDVIDCIGAGSLGNCTWIPIFVTALIFLVLKFLHPYLCKLAFGKIQTSFYSSLGESVVFGRQEALEGVNVGQATTNFTSDVAGVCACTDRIFRRGIADVFLFVFSAFVLFRTNIWIGVTAVTASVVPVAVMFFVSKLLVSENQRFQQTLQKINGKMAGELGSIEFIKANGLEEFVLKDNKYSLRTLLCAKRRLSIFDAVVGLPMLLCPFITVFSVSALGGYLVLNGKIGIGQLFAVITLADNIVSPVMRFDNTIRRIRRGNACLLRLDKLIKIRREREDTAVKTESTENKLTLSVNGLSFSYPNGKSVFIDKNISFTSGGINVLVGENGAGKSTLLKILCGVYEAQSGEIVFDGEKDRIISTEDLRKYIIADTQTPLFFSGSLRDIISKGEEHDEEDIMELCRKLGLESDILALSEGLDTVLEADGGFLSGGQKRRISLVSSLLRRGRVYIFDEPTAGVDEMNTEKILSVLELLSREHLVIVITHDTKIISMGNRVVRFEAEE